MKILVTGSSGHLGEALVRTLRTGNHEVVGIDILPSEFTDKVGSIANRQFVKQCMKGINAVMHTATLHKPHVATHSNQKFIDTNISGTLNLLEEGLAAGIDAFILTSTTSTFGGAMVPKKGQPAVWITEEVIPVPKNIYGVTKTTAENLCELFSRNHNLPNIVLRTSRFFPEDDDQELTRLAYENDNTKVNELLYRRVDIMDVVSAHIQALEKASSISFGKYIISATTPFTYDDLSELASDAPKVVKRLYPDYAEVFKGKGWKMFPSIERVYVNERARKELDWQPKYDFRYALDCIKSGIDYRSALSIKTGSKGYHTEKFEKGPYPIK